MMPAGHRFAYGWHHAAAQNLGAGKIFKTAQSKLL
jgi:hypothetical protein